MNKEKNSSTIKASAARGTHEKILQMVRDFSKPKETLRILDFPCGKGALTQVLLQDGYQVVSADKFIEIFALDVDIVSADLNAAMPWQNETFDVVISADGLCEVDGLSSTLREFKRILKPGGIAIFSLPNPLNIRSRLRFLLTGFFNKYTMAFDEVHGQSTTRIIFTWELRYHLVRNGLDITSYRATSFKPMDVLLAPLWLATVFSTFLYGFTKYQKLQPAMQRRIFSILKMKASPAIGLGENLIVQCSRVPSS